MEIEAGGGLIPIGALAAALAKLLSHPAPEPAFPLHPGTSFFPIPRWPNAQMPKSPMLLRGSTTVSAAVEAGKRPRQRAGDLALVEQDLLGTGIDGHDGVPRATVGTVC
jgi:hypothetical protein